MDSVIITYNLVLFLSCGYAVVFGGKSGVAGAVLFIGASKLSAVVGDPSMGWSGTIYELLIVDFTVLLALFLLARFSGRYWPIWAAGLQLVTVLTHAATAIAPGILPEIYHAVASFWSLPILLIMVIGTALDRQHDLRQRRQQQA